MSAALTSASVQRVRAALAAHGLADRIVELAATARTAEDAALACGVPVGAIVKSLVFDGRRHGRPGPGRRRPPLRLTALPAALGLTGAARRCDAATVRAVTGFAIGGVAPVGHLGAIPTAIDASLARFPLVYAAAGHPHCVFATDLAQLQALTGGTICELASPPIDTGEPANDT